MRKNFLESVEVELLKTTAMEEDFPSILGVDETESSVVDDLLNCSLHVASIVVVCELRRNDWERLGRMTYCRKSPFSPAVRLRSGSVKKLAHLCIFSIMQRIFSSAGAIGKTWSARLM